MQNRTTPGPLPDPSDGRRAPALTALGACVAASAAFVADDPVRVLEMAGGGRLIMWTHRGLWTAAAVLGPVLAALAWRLAGRAGARSRLVHALAPLALLPLLVPILWWTGRIPAVITGTALFAIPVLSAALVLQRALAPVVARDARPRAWATWAGGLFLVGWAGYAGLGWYYSATIGPHSGDEGHYIIQAESLHRDGDLDIRNDLERWAGPDVQSRFTPDYLHISPSARGGHWYSWHPFGLSLLLAPAMGWGHAGLHLVLGLIAGAGLAGMLLLCRRAGAPLGASAAAVLLFGLSHYWCAHAARAYPEVLGAALLAWAGWAVLAQEDRPWLATLVAAACCSYLPWAHTRFVPAAGLAAGLFGLRCLAGPAAWRAKLARASAFGLLCAAGAALYLAVYRSMFEGGRSYPMEAFLFSYPPGAWYAISDACGIVAILPLALWMLAAHAYAGARGSGLRRPAIASFAIFAATLVTCCAHPVFTGGESISGRFLLIVAPALLPVTAAVLARANPAARLAFLVLGGVSVAYTLIVTPSLLDMPFNRPATQIPECLPRFRGLVDPFAFHFAGRSDAAAARISDIAVVVALASTLAMIALGRRRWVAVAAALATAGAAAGAHMALERGRPHATLTPAEIAGLLAKSDLDRSSFTRPTSAEPMLLLDAANSFPPGDGDGRFASLTTADLGVRARGALVSQPRIESNDWAGRPLPWCTLVQPFGAGRGWRLLRIRGQLEGAARLALAVREGDATLYEGPVAAGPHGRVDTSLVLRCRGGQRTVGLLAQLSGGDGLFRTESIAWAPVSRSLIEQANLRLPDGARWIETGR